jgi:hypothetical protein
MPLLAHAAQAARQGCPKAEIGVTRFMMILKAPDPFART